MHLHTHTHMLAHTFTQSHIPFHTLTCLHTHTCQHLFAYIYTRSCNHTCIHTPVCSHSNTHVLMHSHMYAHSQVLTLTLICTCLDTLPLTYIRTHSHPLMLTHSMYTRPHTHTQLHRTSCAASPEALAGEGGAPGEEPLRWLPSIPQGRRPGLGKFQSLRPADSAFLSLAA